MNNRTTLEVALVAGAIALAHAAHAETTWYVDDDNCPGPGSGTEADPYCSIQTAIDHAAEGDEVLVAPGTYHEAISVPQLDLTVRSAGGPAVTVIDGTGLDDAVASFVKWHQRASLEGFTIANGVGYDSPYHTRLGGGLYVRYANPTIVNCVFLGNTATHGGAVYAFESQMTLIDCVFAANTAALSGGGLSFEASSPVLEGCTIVGNKGGTGGGLVAVSDVITLSDCVLSGNSASGGGGLASVGADVTLDRCRITGNSAVSVGGGVSSGLVPGNYVGLFNCIVSYNTSLDGGGVAVLDGTADLVNCTLVGNAAHGLFLHPDQAVTAAVSNCVVWGNLPDQVFNEVGDALTVSYSDLEGGWDGPGVGNISADPLFAEDLSGAWTSDAAFDDATDLTLLTDANADFAPGGLVGQAIIPNTTFGDLQTAVLANTATTITVVGEFWSLLVSQADGYVIRADHVLPGSPCIDAGDNTAVPEGVTTDFAGNPRFLDVPETPDTGHGDPPIVDMGALESLGGGCLAITSLATVCHGDGSTFTVTVEGLNSCTGGTTMATFTGSGGAVGEDLCATLLINTEQGGYCCSTQVCVAVPDCSGAVALCDLDGDGIVGVPDFLALLGAWGPNPGHPADLNFDGEVGVGDFLILLANWGP